MDGTAGWRGPNDARVWDGRPRQEQARPRSFRLNTDAQLGPSFHRAEPGPPGSRLAPFCTTETRRNKREQEQCLFHPFRDFQCHQRAYFPSMWPIVADLQFCSCVRGRPEREEEVGGGAGTHRYLAIRPSRRGSPSLRHNASLWRCRSPGLCTQTAWSCTFWGDRLLWELEKTRKARKRHHFECV